MTDTDFQKSSADNEFIAFLVNEHEFCVDIQYVREIRGWSHATPLPHSPDYVIGVMNLRGAILPIIDLSARLGMSASDPGKNHVIMVAQVGEKTFGILVNSVSDIVQVDSEQLRSVPELNSAVVKDFFRNIIVMEDRIVSEIVLESIIPEFEAEAA